MKASSENRKDSSEPERAENEPATPGERATLTTCIETIDGDPSTAIRLSFQIKVF